MQKIDHVSWKEIYKYWNLYRMSGPDVLKTPMIPVEIHAHCDRHHGVLYGYDWLSREDYFARREAIKHDVIDFMYSTKKSNKGTVHTVNMLLNAVSEEERAAIWIYAFAKEMLDQRSQGNISQYACQLCDAAYDFLAKYFHVWHHAMKKLVPNLCISRPIYLKTDFKSIHAVIELARLNAALVSYEYIPVLYTSVKPGEQAPEISARRKLTDRAGLG